jgi:hypothetical protein
VVRVGQQELLLESSRRPTKVGEARGRDYMVCLQQLWEA